MVIPEASAHDTVTFLGIWNHNSWPLGSKYRGIMELGLKIIQSWVLFWPEFRNGPYLDPLGAASADLGVRGSWRYEGLQVSG